MKGAITLVLLQLFTLQGRPKTNVQKTLSSLAEACRGMTRDSPGAERRSLGAARGFQTPSAARRLAAVPRAGGGSGGSPSGGDPAPLPHGVPVSPARSAPASPAARRRNRAAQLLRRDKVCSAERGCSGKWRIWQGRCAAWQKRLPRPAGKAKPELLQARGGRESRREIAGCLAK